MTRMIFLAATIALTALTTTMLWGQQPGPGVLDPGAIELESSPTPTIRLTPANPNPAGTTRFYPLVGWATPETIEVTPAQRERTQAAKALNEFRKNSKTSSANPNFETLARDALTEYFDADMRYREEQLKDFRTRVEQSRARLGRREAARDELIALQLRSFQLDAEGLGLSTKRPRRGQPLGGLLGGGDAFGESGGGYGSDAVIGMGGTSPFGVTPMGPQRSRFGDSSGGYDGGAGLAQGGESSGDPREDALFRIRVAGNKLTRQESGSQRPSEGDEQAVLQELEAALGKYFDADLKLRQEELKSLSEQLSRMETKLAARADAKDEIIDVQLKMIVNEASGLGFFSSSTSRQNPLMGPPGL